MDVKVRDMQEADLAAAERIRRLAFGTYLGVADPAQFQADSGMVVTRWRADPSAAFVAEADGVVVGSNFVTSWGSVGFFGPLSVHPDLWDQRVATRLMEPTMATFTRWGTRHLGLFTFAQSPKHIGLYQKFGFWPRFLTAIMALPVRPLPSSVAWAGYSALAPGERLACLTACRTLTDSLYPGLDVAREIHAVEAQGLGETVLLLDGSSLTGLAVCHIGAGTEAGTDTCFIKFGAVRPGPSAAADFVRMLDACEGLAAERHATRLVAGVNTARAEAYAQLLARGFRTERTGVTMHRPNEPGYSYAEAYVLDDWR